MIIKGRETERGILKTAGRPTLALLNFYPDNTHTIVHHMPPSLTTVIPSLMPLYAVALLH